METNEHNTKEELNIKENMVDEIIKKEVTEETTTELSNEITTRSRKIKRSKVYRNFLLRNLKHSKRNAKERQDAASITVKV